MMYRKVECPHCGNEITVNNTKEEDKCRWCRRLISIKFKKTGKNKFNVEVEPIDFPKDSKPKYKKEDFYGF